MLELGVKGPPLDVALALAPFICTMKLRLEYMFVRTTALSVVFAPTCEGKIS
jgi:hypothetical protein